MFPASLRMQLGGAAPPFPAASVNLITCTSNSGKSHLLQKIFLHPGAFIEDHVSIRHIIYINCNKRDIGFIHLWQQNPVVAFELVSLGIEELGNLKTWLSVATLLFWMIC